MEFIMENVIGTKTITQIAFVVRDIELTKKKFADFFGMEAPNHFATQKTRDNIYNNEPAPDISAMLAFIDIGAGLQIELIQPNGASSVWQDVLDQQGEGFHHIAFRIEGMDNKIQACENLGMRCLQRGNGYAYLDAFAGINCLIELLGE